LKVITREKSVMEIKKRNLGEEGCHNRTRRRRKQGGSGGERVAILRGKGKSNKGKAYPRIHLQKVGGTLLE